MNTEMILQYLPFLIPLAIAELALAITALVHVLRHPHYRFGTKAMWIVIVLVIEFIGPIVYFAFGRGDAE
ncbi:MAG: PLD nuclease N-terminal domain-containing protein [Anaerofustis sp.]